MAVTRPAVAAGPTRRPVEVGRRPALPHPVVLAASVIGAVLYAARGWPRIASPGLWAEDGDRFLPESHDLGAASLFHPFAGYVHVIPRAIALAVTALPLAAVPEAYTVGAVVCALLFFAAVLSRRLEWLLPSAAARGAVFVLLCVLPAASEPYGNLANLIFLGGIATMFLGLSADPRSVPGRIAELVAVALLVLSGPVSLLVFPVYAHRLWRARSRHSAAVGMVFLAAAITQVGVYLHSARTTADDGTIGELARAAGIRLSGTWLVGAGHWRSDWVGGHLGLYGPTWLAVAALVAVAVLRWAGVAILAAATTTLGAAVKAYGPAILAPGLDRHVAVPLAALVTVLVASCDQGWIRWRAARTGRADAMIHAGLAALAAVCLVAGFEGVTRDFHLNAYSPRPDMALLQPCARNLSPVCRVPEAPRGWVAVLRRPGR